MALNCSFNQDWKRSGEYEELGIGDVTFSVHLSGSYPGDGLNYFGTGTIILTKFRIVFVNNRARSRMQSFCIPFILLESELSLNLPWIWGTSVLSGSFNGISELGIQRCMQFEISFPIKDSAECFYKMANAFQSQCQQCMIHGSNEQQDYFMVANPNFYYHRYLKATNTKPNDSNDSKTDKIAYYTQTSPLTHCTSS